MPKPCGGPGNLVICTIRIELSSRALTSSFGGLEVDSINGSVPGQLGGSPGLELRSKGRIAHTLGTTSTRPRKRRSAASVTRLRRSTPASSSTERHWPQLYLGPRRSGFAAQRAVQSTREIHKRNFERLAEAPHFDHIQPPFPSLALAYERLRLVEPSRQFDLSNPRPPPCCTELSQKLRVTLRMQRFLHAGLPRS
jgi:hypothetical protein